MTQHFNKFVKGLAINMRCKICALVNLVKEAIHSFFTKGKFISSLPVYLLFFALIPQWVLAEEFIPVDPNIYEENHIGVPTEYLHEKSLFKLRNRLPEEQKFLTFKPKKNKQAEVNKYLFSKEMTMSERNSLAWKVEELGLFTGEQDRKLFVLDEDTNVAKNNTKWLTILFGLFICLSICCLMILAPRINSGNHN